MSLASWLSPYNAGMVLLLASGSLALALLQSPAHAHATAAPAQEAVVAATLEDLRKGELFLDASAIEPIIAASFTLIEDGARVSGSFAYLEPIRRLRERGGEVKELRFEQTLVQVFGASAVASYRFVKSWREGGVRHHEQGWSSDVFELRDDGAWILVHRHRGR
jgi:hypothetical protein